MNTQTDTTTDQVKREDPEVVERELAEMRAEMKRLQAWLMKITMREYEKPCPF